MAQSYSCKSPHCVHCAHGAQPRTREGGGEWLDFDVGTASKGGEIGRISFFRFASKQGRPRSFRLARDHTHPDLCHIGMHTPSPPPAPRGIGQTLCQVRAGFRACVAPLKTRTPISHVQRAPVCAPGAREMCLHASMHSRCSDSGAGPSGAAQPCVRRAGCRGGRAALFLTAAAAAAGPGSTRGCRLVGRLVDPQGGCTGAPGLVAGACVQRRPD